MQEAYRRRRRPFSITFPSRHLRHRKGASTPTKVRAHIAVATRNAKWLSSRLPDPHGRGNTKNPILLHPRTSSIPLNDRGGNGARPDECWLLRRSLDEYVALTPAQQMSAPMPAVTLATRIVDFSAARTRNSFTNKDSRLLPIKDTQFLATRTFRIQNASPFERAALYGATKESHLRATPSSSPLD